MCKALSFTKPITPTLTNFKAFSIGLISFISTVNPLTLYNSKRARRTAATYQTTQHIEKLDSTLTAINKKDKKMY